VMAVVAMVMMVVAMVVTMVTMVVTMVTLVVTMVTMVAGVMMVVMVVMVVMMVMEVVMMVVKLLVGAFAPTLKGGGQDSMLVHMTPGEVGGLQQLAMAHGGSLTINPQTGLPEAGMLSRMLPMVIGAALAPMTAGTSLAFLGTPMGAALTVGGLSALSSGSLKKGLMAGLGAYGGANLGSSLSSMGAEQAQELAAADTISSGNASVDSVGAFAKANQQAAIEQAVQKANVENAAGNFGDDLYMGDDAYRASLSQNPIDNRLSYNARPADFATNPFSQQGVGYAQSLGDPVANIQQQAIDDVV
jgi:hypothetical protein